MPNGYKNLKTLFNAILYYAISKISENSIVLGHSPVYEKEKRSLKGLWIWGKRVAHMSASNFINYFHILGR